MNPNNYNRYGQYYFNPTWAPSASPASCSQPGVVYNNVVLFTVAPDGTHYFHQTYGGQFTLPEANTEPPIPTSYPELQNKPRASRRRKSNECRGTTEAQSELEKKNNCDEKDKLCEKSDKYKDGEEKSGKTEENMAPQDEWASDCEDTQYGDLDESTDFSQDEDDEDPSQETQEDHNQGDPVQRHTQGRQNRDPRSSIVSMFPLPNMNLFGGPPDP